MEKPIFCKCTRDRRGTRFERTTPSPQSNHAKHGCFFLYISAEVQHLRFTTPTMRQVECPIQPIIKNVVDLTGKASENSYIETRGIGQSSQPVGYSIVLESSFVDAKSGPRPNQALIREGLQLYSKL
jgi:hypothetical protein